MNNKKEIHETINGKKIELNIIHKHDDYLEIIVKNLHYENEKYIVIKWITFLIVTHIITLITLNNYISFKLINTVYTALFILFIYRLTKLIQFGI